MLLMVEKGIRGGRCHAIYTYAKENNKYLKNYDTNKESLYILYLDANSFYGWAMSKNCLQMVLNGKKNMLKINDFIKSYHEDSDKGYILEVDIDFLEEPLNLHIDFPFLAERMKIDKYNKLVCNLYDKIQYVVHKRALKEALNHGLILKKVHRVIEINQEAWLKEYIDINTELRIDAKNDFERDFFRLMNSTVFGKTMENIMKHRDIKLVTTDKS